MIFYRNHGCQKCKGKITKNEVIQFIEEKGFASSNLTYENEDSVITFVCSRGHTFSKSFGGFKDTPKCPECSKYSGWFHNLGKLGINAVKIGTNKVSINGRVLSINELTKELSLTVFQLYDYKPIEVVSGLGTGRGRDRIKVECGNGHVFVTTIRYLLEGHGCKICSSQAINKPEMKIAEYLGLFGYEITIRDKRILKGKELDMYIPKLNLAIEYTGIRWHSAEMSGSKRGPLSQHHLQEKMFMCRDVGVRLITILESDYLHRNGWLFEVLRGILEGKELETKDLCYAKIKNPSEPRKRTFNRKGQEVSVGCYTIYDCGENLDPCPTESTNKRHDRRK